MFKFRSKFISKGEQSMYILKEKLFYFGVSFVMQKDSPYKLKFSEKIDQLKQAGFIDHWIATEQDRVARITSTGNNLEIVTSLSIVGDVDNIFKASQQTSKGYHCGTCRLVKMTRIHTNSNFQFQAPFYLLGLLSAMAIIVFVIEVSFKFKLGSDKT